MMYCNTVICKAIVCMLLEIFTINVKNALIYIPHLIRELHNRFFYATKKSAILFSMQY